MSSFLQSPYVVVRCDLAVDGVEAFAVQQVHREIWNEHPDGRALVEKELRFAAAQRIVEKLAPTVYEVDASTLRRDAVEPISRAEALRLAEVHGKALAELSLRLEVAGENYAVTDASRAVEAARLLVEKLASDEGRLPVRPGEEPTP